MKRYFKYLVFLPVVLLLALTVQPQSLQAATIGGNVYSGTGTVVWTNNIVGAPVAVRTPNTLQSLNGAIDTIGINGARVMISDMETGKFVAYGTFVDNITNQYTSYFDVNALANTVNSWMATVPDTAGLLVATYSAPGHQTTSRVFDVPDCTLVACPAVVPLVSVDAYLPALYQDLTTGAVNPATNPAEPLGNILAYAFTETAVNGADDGTQNDPGLSGTLMELYDPQDPTVVMASCTTYGPDVCFETRDHIFFGNPAGCPGDPPGAIRIDSTGYCHFTDIAPGEYKLRATPPAPPTGGEYYYTYTMEGGKDFDVLLEPGSPGTEAGGYLAWFAFVDNAVGQPTGGTASMHGFIEDADVLPWEPGEPDPPLLALRNLGVTSNGPPSNAFIVLWSETENPWGPTSEVVAVVDADPVTGEFWINNIPAGQYFMFISDKKLDYVFKELNITLAPGEIYEFTQMANEPNVPNANLIASLPTFGGKMQGTVTDNLTGAGIPGATVNIRYRDGSLIDSTTTLADGSYSFERILEIEVMAFMDVVPPAGYRGALVTDTYNPAARAALDVNGNPCDPTTVNCVIAGAPLDLQRNGAGRYIQWFTATYTADFILEQINDPVVPTPVNTQVSGWVFNDTLDMLSGWTPDGAWDQLNEGIIEGVTIDLLDANGIQVTRPALDSTGAPIMVQAQDALGNLVFELDGVTPVMVPATLPVTTTTGAYNVIDVIGQGYAVPGQKIPGNEWGGLHTGPTLGYYEFRDLGDLSLPAGTYGLRVTPPPGFMQTAPAAPQEGSFIVPISINPSVDPDVRNDIGLTTRVPQAGIAAGGLFDNVNTDTRSWSTFAAEKALLTGLGVRVTDYLGYEVDTLVQPSGVCYGLAPNPVDISTPGGNAVAGDYLTTYGWIVSPDQTTALDPTLVPPDTTPHGAVCDRPDLGFGVEVERRIAPTTLLYTGNDPALPLCDLGNSTDPAAQPLSPPGTEGEAPCYNTNFMVLELPYGMGQGLFTLVDWSLDPPMPDQGGLDPVVLFGPMCATITSITTQMNTIDPQETVKWSAQVTVQVDDNVGTGVPNAEVWAGFAGFESKLVTTNGLGAASFMAPEIVGDGTSIDFTVDLVRMIAGNNPAWSADPACKPGINIPRPPFDDPGVVIPPPENEPAPGNQPGGGDPVGDIIVSELEPNGIDLGEGKWMAEVTITVMDDIGPITGGLEVAYKFGAGEVKQAIPDADGTLTVTSESFEEGPDSVLFRIDHLDHPQYNPAASVTEIVVEKP